MTDLIKTVPVKAAVVTAAAIITALVLGQVIGADLFRLDCYMAVVSISFFIIGYSLTNNSPAKNEFNRGGQNAVALKTLSAREISILRLIASGATNKEIARSLGIEVSTVKTHVNNTYQKTGIRNRKQARENWNTWQAMGLIS